jgi:hypothetical protein
MNELQNKLPELRFEATTDKRLGGGSDIHVAGDTDLLGRFFTSDEGGIISGVSPEKQRLWRTRGLVPFDRLPEAKGNKRRVLSWETIVQYGVMAEAVRAGIEIECAGWFASAETIPQLASRDFRREEGGDPLYLFCKPLPGDPKSYANVTTGAGPMDFSAGDYWGRFGFWLNFSALQRALVARLLSL